MRTEKLILKVNETLIAFIEKILSQKVSKEATVSTLFSTSGGQKTELFIDNTLIPISVFDIDEEFSQAIGKYFNTQYIQLNPYFGYRPDVEKWNKAVFEYSKEGILKAAYTWDTQLYYEESKRRAYSFCHWLQGRLTDIMYEKQGLKDNQWEKATGEFWVKDNEVIFKGVAYNKKNKMIPLSLNVEDWNIQKEFLEHHTITNTGLLKDTWKPWNKITVYVSQSDYFRESDHTDYALDNGDGGAEKIEGLPVKYD